MRAGRKLEAAGFEAEQVRGFLTVRQARWYGLLRAQPLRAMNRLHVIRLGGVRRAAIGPEEYLFRALARPAPESGPASYLLIVAR